MNETKALMRYLGTVHGYYPKDAVMQWQADCWVDYAPTLITKIAPFMFKPTLEADGEKVMKDAFTEAAEKIAKTLQHGKPFLVGTMPCIGDFSVYAYLAMWAYNENHKFAAQIKPIFEQVFAEQPMFHQYMKRMMEENKAHHMALPPRPM